MSMIIDGTNGLTFNNATTQNSAGTLLQTVFNTVGPTSTYASTTNNANPVSTGHAATITPKFANSKILILVSAYVGMNNSACNGGVFTIYRNSTNLAGGNNNGLAAFDFASYNGIGTSNLGLSYVDSPSTTSSTTYTVYFYTNGGTLLYCCSVGGLLSNTLATITLMEISA